MNLVNNKSYILIDRALHSSNKKSCFSICSFIDMDDYIMTTGGGILLHPELRSSKAMLTIFAKYLKLFSEEKLLLTSEFQNAVQEVYSFFLVKFYP